MKRIALFDFDGTLIPGDSIVHLLKYAAARKEIGFLRVLPGIFGGLLYVLRFSDERAAKNRALGFLTRMRQEERDRFLDSFVNEALIPRVYRKGLDEIRSLRKQGFAVWLVSASTDNYMERIRQYLEADRLICTVPDKNGRVQVNCKGEEKVRRIQEALKNVPDTVILKAYADSKSDLPMLKLAKEPLAVNPKKALIKAAPQIRRIHWQ